MKNRIASQLAICLAGAIGLAAQSLPPTAFQAVPELPYRLQPNFFELPNGVNFGEASAVAVNSRGHIFLFQRVKPMLMEYDPSGKFLRSLGEGLFTVPHGLRFDAEDNLWTTDVGSHVVLKLSPEGRVLMVLGRKDDGAEADWLFNRPTDIAFDRNFRFAFWLRTNIPAFASARDLSCIRFHPKAPGVPSNAFAGTHKPSFAPFRSDFTHTPPSTPLRRPDLFCLAAAPIQRAVAKPEFAAACFQTCAASDGSWARRSASFTSSYPARRL